MEGIRVNEPPAKTSGRGSDKHFIGTLRGEEVHLPRVKVEEITYTKRSPEETNDLRRVFDRSVRSQFLKEFANDSLRVNYLREAGLEEVDIERMKIGRNPKGWQVHHNLGKKVCEVCKHNMIPIPMHACRECQKEGHPSVI